MAKNIDSLAAKDYAYLIGKLDEQIEDRNNPLVKIYLEAYSRKAKKRKDKLNLFYAYKEGVYFSDNLNTQLKYADSAIEMAVKLQNKELMATAFLSKGLAFYKAKDFRHALQNYLNADTQLQQSKDQYLRHKVLFNMAIIKLKLNHYSQAEELLLQCERFFGSNTENKNDQAYWLNTIYHLGGLHQEIGNKGKAKEYNQIGRNKSKAYHDEFFYKYFTINDGIDKVLNNQLQEGIQSLTATEPFLKKENDFNTLTKVYYYKAIAYNNLKLNDEKVQYFNKVRAALKQALKEGLLTYNPAEQVQPFPQDEVQREFLSLEEVQTLVHTPCKNETLKRMFLFSCLTGLRWSDIEKLKWSEVQYSEQLGNFLRFKQQKTNGAEMQPISEDARTLLGEEGNPKDNVFTGFKYGNWNKTLLKDWMTDAGIKKHITFHCARHTYATLQLTLGTDIYTVSKLLGHKNLSTTEIYTKVINEKKIEAANKIKLNL
ncbi:site-specific integrase [Empedobacter falsenii]